MKRIIRRIRDNAMQARGYIRRTKDYIHYWIADYFFSRLPRKEQIELICEADALPTILEHIAENEADLFEAYLPESIVDQIAESENEVREQVRAVRLECLTT